MRPLDIQSLRNRLGDLGRFNRVEYFASVGSTNALALERLYTNDSLGISFVTESQTEGRGRAGRSWLSPPGSGLLVSTILPSELPAKALSAVGFWAALAVRKAVESSTGVRLGLKWPNDLLLGDRKCVGILTQGRSRAHSSRVVIGVGINANRPEAVPDEIAPSAAWLSEATDAPIDRTVLLAALLHAYEESFDSLLSAPRKIIAAWSSDAALVGRVLAVKAVDGSLLQRGTVSAIDHEGSLVLATEAGERIVRLGDVEVLS